MADLTSFQTLTLAQVYAHHKGGEITGRKLAASIGLVNKNKQRVGADMRAVINALRTKGYPICANGKGYYWAASPGELREFTESFERRIEDQYKAMRGMKANTPYTPIEIIEI